jgi:hypothetical protein
MSKTTIELMPTTVVINREKQVEYFYQTLLNNEDASVRGRGISVRFEVLKAESMKKVVFWVVGTCSLVQVY